MAEYSALEPVHPNQHTERHYIDNEEDRDMIQARADAKSKPKPDLSRKRTTSPVFGKRFKLAGTMEPQPLGQARRTSQTEALGGPMRPCGPQSLGQARRTSQTNVCQ